MFDKIIYFRDKVKINLPKLSFIFTLIETNSLRNNRLFKKNLTLSKGNRSDKLGRLFFTLSLIFIFADYEKNYWRRAH